MTVIYSALHLLVDGMCALAMFGRLLPGGDRGLSILVYNFCAFALQMPLGVALDALCVGKKGREADFPFLFVLAGVLCTVGGAFLHPAVLGIGNALFHVGGGVGTIREDDRRSWRGRGLGVFVAPGALGLYLGTVLGRGGSWQMWAFGTGVLMALLCAGAIWGRKAHHFEVSGRNLLSVLHCHAARAGRAVPVQYDHAHYPVLAGAQHAPDAGICLWAADICPVPGLPAYIFRGGCGSGRPCAGLCRQRAVHASADGGAGGGERGNWPYTVDRQDLQWRPRESTWLAVYSRVALQI